MLNSINSCLRSCFRTIQSSFASAGSAIYNVFSRCVCRSTRSLSEQTQPLLITIGNSRPTDLASLPVQASPLMMNVKTLPPPPSQAQKIEADKAKRAALYLKYESLFPANYIDRILANTYEQGPKYDPEKAEIELDNTFHQLTVSSRYIPGGVSELKWISTKCGLSVDYLKAKIKSNLEKNPAKIIPEMMDELEEMLIKEGYKVN